MKNSFIYFLLLLFFTTGSLKAQTFVHDTEEIFISSDQKSNYICDSIFKVYTGYWLDWWKHTLKIEGPIPGKNPPANFIFPYSDLEFLDSLGRNHLIPDSVEAFFAFTSQEEAKKNQLKAIFLLRDADSLSFNESTERWRKWSKKHIKGEQPVGFKIRFADLDSVYQLLNDKSNQVKSIAGYFAFHSIKDKKSNRISLVLRPTFKGKQKKVRNEQISCGQSTIRTGQRISGISFINIDFTNPCPPCDTSG